jgi:hypothetical protein
MPILISDVQFFKSTASGPGTGGATIQSLGDAITTNQLTDGLLNDLFDDVIAAESTSGRIEYRCIYLQNKDASLTLQDTDLYIDANAPNPNVNCAIGLDPVGANGVAATIVDEITAPVGVIFSEPDAGSPFSLGDLLADEFYAFWIRRVVAAGANASAGDSLTLGFIGASDP